jgi:hypothetical protein
VTRNAGPRPRFLRSWSVWTAGFLAFPVAGLAGTAVAGRIDTPVAALLGGAVTGVVIGAGQAVVSSRRLDLRGWIPTTGIAVDQQFIVFGSYGAVTFCALSGLLLHRLLPPGADTDPDRAVPSRPGRHQTWPRSDRAV